MGKKTVIIIGGGLGGLFTGAILAKEGMSVTVLEKNTTIGGGLQSFRRFGQVFDTGMHIVGGMQPGGNVRRICDYLGISDKVRLKDVDPQCTDKLYFAEDKTFYSIPRGKEAFINKLSEDFPLERENLEKYVEAIYGIAERIDLFNLRPQNALIFLPSEDFAISADAFIARYIKDRKLRSVLAYMNAFYGGKEDETPAYIHAIISVLYLNGPNRFVDGSYHFANLLAEVIETNGGQILTRKKVEQICVQNKEIKAVKTTDGSNYSADCYVSDIHPCTLLKLMDDEKAFPKSYRNRLNEIPNSYSAFSLYIKCKEKSFPYINHSEYYMSRYEDIWHFGDKDRAWPLGFLVMTPPDTEEDQAYSSKVLVTAPMPFDFVKPWEDTTVGNRGESYKQWKQECAEILIDKMEEIHPGFRDCIEKMETSSPLSIRDYYGVKEGALAGYSKNYHNLVFSHVSVVTKVKNLYLTGQNVNLPGFCGVSLTAITTAEALLGQNFVLNKINKELR